MVLFLGVSLLTTRNEQQLRSHKANLIEFSFFLVFHYAPCAMSCPHTTTQPALLYFSFFLVAHYSPLEVGAGSGAAPRQPQILPYCIFLFLGGSLLTTRQ
jgi:hypothetical protein